MSERPQLGKAGVRYGRVGDGEFFEMRRGDNLGQCLIAETEIREAERLERRVLEHRRQIVCFEADDVVLHDPVSLQPVLTAGFFDR